MVSSEKPSTIETQTKDSKFRIKQITQRKYLTRTCGWTDNLLLGVFNYIENSFRGHGEKLRNSRDIPNRFLPRETKIKRNCLFSFSFAVPSISDQLGTSCTKCQNESSRWSHGLYVISRNVMNRPVVVHHAISPNSCLACYFYANKIVLTSRAPLKLISILIEFNELLCNRWVTRYDWGSSIYLLRQRSIWAIDMSVTCVGG